MWIHSCINTELHYSYRSNVELALANSGMLPGVYACLGSSLPPILNLAIAYGHITSFSLVLSRRHHRHLDPLNL
jgi:hypothetical protein